MALPKQRQKAFDLDPCRLSRLCGGEGAAQTTPVYTIREALWKREERPLRMVLLRLTRHSSWGYVWSEGEHDCFLETLPMEEIGGKA